MTSKTTTAELLDDARATIGEGPVWDDRSQRLLWVDIPAGRVHRLDPTTGKRSSLEVGQPVGAVGLGADGGLVAAVRDGFALFPPSSGRISRLLPVERSRSGNRMNDGKCDRRGRFWAGTMATDHTPASGTLYRLERTKGDYAVSAIFSGITVANGLDWSPDDKLMYYIDSPTQRIDVFDFDEDSGALAKRRVFAEIAAADGMPDGMTVDAEGHVWVALFHGAKVRRYRPDGAIDLEVKVPVTLVTSCAFGGPHAEDLYITTARHRLTPAEAAEQTTAGGVFVCRPGPAGRLPFRFG
jgi:sugar lactone lactonase YvrE